MDDATGTIRPQDASLYTMRLHGDGSVNLRLNCNQASGSWSATPSSDATSGRFEFGPLAMTRAFCPPPGMDGSIAAQARFIRAYLIRDSRLYLNLIRIGSERYEIPEAVVLGG